MTGQARLKTRFFAPLLVKTGRELPPGAVKLLSNKYLRTGELLNYNTGKRPVRQAVRRLQCLPSGRIPRTAPLRRGDAADRIRPRDTDGAHVQVPGSGRNHLKKGKMNDSCV